jgi:hypothetical protein
VKKLIKWGAALAVVVIIGAAIWQMPRAGLIPTSTPAQATPQPTILPTAQPTAQTAPSLIAPTLPPQPTHTIQITATPTLSDTPPSPGKSCGAAGQDELLPGTTPPSPEPGLKPTQPIPPTPAVLDLTQLSQRAGFAMSTTANPEIWADKLRSGWFLSWSVKLRSVKQIPEHWQMVRLRPGCYYPSQAYIRWVAARYPGLVWIIGNEPDVIWQDSLTPEEYAQVYHDFYEIIKTADPSARLAVGAISQATPLRLEYLDRVLKAYQASYSQPLPADWWTVHGFVLREERKSWGVEIPPGMTQDQGELREVSDHGRMDLFQQQIIAFRGWMAANGYRDVPLALTEFGILMPVDYGYSLQFVTQYLQESFAWLQSTTDDTLGLRADGNRLVQRWAWFSLADRLYPAPDLADLSTGNLTGLGKAFRDYVIQNKP